MNEIQKSHMRIASAKLQAGDIAGWASEIIKALTKSGGKGTTKIKAIPITTTSGSLEPQDKSRREEVLASIYDWHSKPSLTLIPMGYKGAEKITVNSKGSTIFVNDFMRTNINVLLTGLVRAENALLMSVNDKAGVLSSWEKHFATVSKNDKEDIAIIQNLYFVLQDRKDGVITADKNIYLFVNAITALSEEVSEMLKVIVETGSAQKVFVVANTDSSNLPAVVFSNGRFSNVVHCESKVSTWTPSNQEPISYTPFAIPASEVEAIESTVTDADRSYLNVPQFVIFGELEKRVSEGLVLSEAVYDLFLDPSDVFAKAHNLSESEIKEFLRIVADEKNHELAFAFGKTVDTIGELAVTMGKILEGEDPETLGFIPVDVPALNIDTEINVTPRAYTDEEIDAMFKESLATGAWKEIAQLDDEQLNMTKDIIGIKGDDSSIADIWSAAIAKEPELQTGEESIEFLIRSEDDSEVEDSDEADEVDDTIVIVTKPSVNTKKTPAPKPENENINGEDAREVNLRIFMNATGLSREEAEKILSE